MEGEGDGVEGGGVEGGGVDRLLADWTRWAAQQRAEQSARGRQRERWLRQQQSEAATLTGVLVDLAERQAAVTIAVGRHRLAGRLVGVGADLCVLQEASGSSLIRLGVVEGIWTGGGQEEAPGPAGPGSARSGSAGSAGSAGSGRAGAASGDRRAVSALRFSEALGALAAELAPVRILLAGGEHLRGDLIGVGLDVVTVSMPAPYGSVYLPAAAIAVCTPV